ERDMRQASFGLIAVAAMATAAQAEIHSFDINMDGSQEAPNPGDPDGSAVGILTIDDVTNEIAWSFTYENLDTLVAMHIHVAPKGSSGPVFVGMGIATSGGPGTLIDSTTTT